MNLGFYVLSWWGTRYSTVNVRCRGKPRRHKLTRESPLNRKGKLRYATIVLSQRSNFYTVVFFAMHIHGKTFLFFDSKQSKS